MFTVLHEHIVAVYYSSIFGGICRTPGKYVWLETKLSVRNIAVRSDAVL